MRTCRACATRVSAGEALPPAIFERFRQRFGVTILDGIGSTEICHIFISNQPDAVRPGSSGKPVAGYETRLLDDDGQPVPTGEVGNLLVKGDSTCALYWNKHEQTKDTIEGHWIRTGDKYRQDEDGYFWYAGRTDDMLKVGGIWVSPVEVENALIEHPAVLEAGVVGREDQRPAGEASRLRGPPGRGRSARPSWAKSCRSSCARGSPNTSGRAGSSSCRSCRRPRPGKTQRFKLRSRA